MKFNLLPEDVILHIFSFISFKVLLGTISSVCKLWHKICEDPTIERKASAKEFYSPSVLATWVYFIVFSFLPILGIDQDLFFKLNLAIHSTLISVILAVLQISTYKAFRVHSEHQKIKRIATSFLLRSSRQIDSPRNGNGRKLLMKKSFRSRGLDRHFIVMTFYLSAILLFSAFPHIGVFYVFLYKQPQSASEELNLNVLLRITEFAFTEVCGT